MPELPFFAVSHDELGEPASAGMAVHCPACGGAHALTAGRDMDGNETGLLLGYRCGDHTYLAAIKGRLLPGAELATNEERVPRPVQP